VSLLLGFVVAGGWGRVLFVLLRLFVQVVSTCCVFFFPRFEIGVFPPFYKRWLGWTKVKRAQTQGWGWGENNPPPPPRFGIGGCSTGWGGGGGGCFGGGGGGVGLGGGGWWVGVAGL